METPAAGCGECFSIQWNRTFPFTGASATERDREVDGISPENAPNPFSYSGTSVFFREIRG
ncbi:MAG TPA: hypothetical protein VGM73_09100 [Candidatus Didemnitutus sp.]|jgi:hypothetical protein